MEPNHFHCMVRWSVLSIFLCALQSVLASISHMLRGLKSPVCNDFLFHHHFCWAPFYTYFPCPSLFPMCQLVSCWPYSARSLEPHFLSWVSCLQLPERWALPVVLIDANNLEATHEVLCCIRFSSHMLAMHGYLVVNGVNLASHLCSSNKDYVSPVYICVSGHKQPGFSAATLCHQ